MKKVYYKGQPFAFKVVDERNQERRYSLYNKDGLLMHFVAERDLDKKPTFLAALMNVYYRSIMEKQPPVLGR
jgi:hypothetical protein